MASNNRKMLYPCQPGQGFPFTFYIPFSPSPPPPPPPPQRDLSVLVSTSFCIIGSVLLFLLTVSLYLYLTTKSRPAAVAPAVSTNRREEENEEEAGERYLSGFYHHHLWRITTAGLQRSAIDSITVVVFKKGEGIIVDGTDCSVCLSEFEEDEALKLLPKCSHAFHVGCIDAWLLSHKNCPLCRAPVFFSTGRKTESGRQRGFGSREEESSGGSRNANVLPRSQSDLASHSGGSGGRLETVRRSFSIGGSSLIKAEGSGDVAGRSRRQFSSSRRSRNQDSVLPS